MASKVPEDLMTHATTPEGGVRGDSVNRRKSESPAGAPAPKRVRRRRRAVAAIAAALLIGVAALLAWKFAAGGKDEAKPQSVPATTAAITGPLSTALRTPGTVNYTDVRDLNATLEGVVTDLPKLGAVVKRGGELYRVDNSPAHLMIGKMPAWRDFAQGMKQGPDVEQLEANLAKLGFFSGTVDQEFTGLTKAAIKAWQKSAGISQSGSIALGTVVFSPHDVRVGAAKAAIGDAVSPGTELYEISKKNLTITANVPATSEPDLSTDMIVDIDLPTGERTQGKVATIGSRTSVEDGSGRSQMVVPLTIVPDDPALLEGYESLAVRLSMSRVLLEDALQVPVTALLAVGERSFVVEVYESGVVTKVPVETGIFSSGMVQITGGDLAAGDQVVVPK